MTMRCPRRGNVFSESISSLGRSGQCLVASHSELRAKRSKTLSNASGRRPVNSRSLHISQAFSATISSSFDSFPSPSAPDPQSPLHSNPDLSFPSHLRNPTPYDIFHLPKTADSAEVKSRYYELVKVLHPDRRLRRRLYDTETQPEKHGRLRSNRSRRGEKGKGRALEEDEGARRIAEEFRLVVRAYEILSSPNARHMYDRFGLGWNDGSSRADSASPSAGFGRSGMASHNEWEELQRRMRWSSSASGVHNRFRPWDHPHDATGWQRASSSSRSSPFPGSPGSEFFHGHYTTPQGDKSRYLSNRTLFSLVAIVSWSIAIAHFTARMKFAPNIDAEIPPSPSSLASSASFSTSSSASSSPLALLEAPPPTTTSFVDARHHSAVQSLREARGKARSDEGRRRLEALKKEARRNSVLMTENAENATGHQQHLIEDSMQQQYQGEQGNRVGHGRRQV